MPIALLLLAAQAAAIGAPQIPVCRAAQLSLSTDGRDGDFNGMSHSGVELSILNRGDDCILPALPRVQFRGLGGRPLPLSRAAPIGMHPGPAMIPVRLGSGHRAVIDLRWVSGPVYPHNRSLRAASVSVRIGKGTLHAPLVAELYGEAGKPATFSQTPASTEEQAAKD